MSEKIIGDWLGQYDPPPIPDRRFDYTYWHKDCDDTNRLCGHAANKDEAINEIIDLHPETLKTRCSQIECETHGCCFPDCVE